MIIYIYNHCNFHFEVIESIYLQYDKIIKVNIKIENPVFYISFKLENKSFLDYLKKKYPNIRIGTPPRYNYCINCTIYTRNINQIIRDGKHFYISHEFSQRLVSYRNIFFVFPKIKERYLSLEYLPFRENPKIKTKIPIYIIQGNLNQYFRRNYHLLVHILKENYNYDFKIKLIGKGILPPILQPYRHKIILKNNLNFQDFHKEFLDGYAILPLISKEKQNHYYTHKLTSSINYAKAYNLKCIMDSELYKLYPLKNSIVYENEKYIIEAFKKSLYDFYDKN